MFIGKDANVMLVTLAAQCLAGIAKGLRTGFKNGASICLPVVLEKFKEKKAAVVAALVEAADALYSPLGIEAIQVRKTIFSWPKGSSISYIGCWGRAFK